MGGKFKRLFWLWMECFKSMRNVKTYVPILIYSIFQLLILLMLVNFANSPFANLLIPLIRRLFGEPALHYPNFFHILPPLYNQINLVISGIIGIVILGIATHIFATNFGGQKPNFGQAFKSTMTKYGILFISWVIVSVLSLLFIIGLPQLLNMLFHPNYQVNRIIELIGLLFAIGLASMFAYMTALIVLDDQKLFKAINQTISLFKSNMLISFLLVAIPTFFYLPISYLSRKTIFLMSKFSPEIIVTILGVGILISFFASYLQIGSITRFYLLLNERRG